MVFFIYKCYYVLFLYYSKNHKEIPWLSASLVLTGSLAGLIMSIMGLSGILDMNGSNAIEESPLAKRSRIYSLVIPLLLICFFTTKHIIFKLAKASKLDGRSERYSFVPSRQDKIICWLACIFSLGSVLITVGI